MSTQFTNKLEALHSKSQMKNNLFFKLIANLANKSTHLLLIGFLLLTFSCSTKGDQPDLSAIPHADALPSTELSKEDKAKLLEASGKTIEPITVKDFQNMLVASDGLLYVYILWHSKCSACIKNIKNLNTYLANKPNDKIKVITINVGESLNLANLTLRSQSISFESYQIAEPMVDWTPLIDEEWDGGLPAIFMVNKADDLFLKYYKQMTENELEAILQTLVI